MKESQNEIKINYVYLKTETHRLTSTFFLFYLKIYFLFSFFICIFYISIYLSSIIYLSFLDGHNLSLKKYFL